MRVKFSLVELSTFPVAFKQDVAVLVVEAAPSLRQTVGEVPLVSHPSTPVVECPLARLFALLPVSCRTLTVSRGRSWPAGHLRTPSPPARRNSRTLRAHSGSLLQTGGGHTILQEALTFADLTKIFPSILKMNLSNSLPTFKPAVGHVMTDLTCLAVVIDATASEVTLQGEQLAVTLVVLLHPRHDQGDVDWLVLVGQVEVI